MRKLVLYIAASADGYIAGPNGDMSFLDPYNDCGSDFGYTELCASVDTTIMGNETYKMITSFDGPFPYSNMANYVLTRDTSKVKDEYVTFLTPNNDIVAEVNALKAMDGKDIWLIGGGAVNKLLLDAGLIDKIILTDMPVELGGGIDLWNRDRAKEQVVTTSPTEATFTVKEVLEFPLNVKQQILVKN